MSLIKNCCILIKKNCLQLQPIGSLHVWWCHQRSSSILKLLLLLLVLEAPQDSRGSDTTAPPPSSIRMSPRPWSSVSPTSDMRSGEKIVEALRGSSSSTKLRASRPREGVTREDEGEEEENGWGSEGESRAWGSREEEEEEEEVGRVEVEEEEKVWRRVWSSSSYNTNRKWVTSGITWCHHVMSDAMHQSELSIILMAVNQSTSNSHSPD